VIPLFGYFAAANRGAFVDREKKENLKKTFDSTSGESELKFYIAK